MRSREIKRTTKETDIHLKLNLDGQGSYTGTCGVGFFDHMMQAFCVHSGFDVELQMKGDLEVDCHHSIEDLGIVLGQAFAQAVANDTETPVTGEDGLYPVLMAAAATKSLKEGRPVKLDEIG